MFSWVSFDACVDSALCHPNRLHYPPTELLLFPQSNMDGNSSDSPDKQSKKRDRSVDPGSSSKSIPEVPQVIAKKSKKLEKKERPGKGASVSDEQRVSSRIQHNRGRVHNPRGEQGRWRRSPDLLIFQHCDWADVCVRGFAWGNLWAHVARQQCSDDTHTWR
ncbi:hypothetical protein M427DRAFT_184249 [Gonapodya prolifera JEL478]|uniref:Uncharacterized protein n=1 Tax=Gonapodya prolifera (strain JEL478) TaxID=1344416 RepID=A0A139A1F5_GONPJ|nr:hypothetical protein M427DRAFT_184249 [Gonapodya prolifera JEL478]|eukprot:KXS10193.1 hypothetical protein M427DRAFT_184249 [Gonapodya prolifera JEL478]